MHRLHNFGWSVAAIATLVLLASNLAAWGFDDPGKLALRLRSRVEADGQFRLIETPASWDTKETAFIVCDMWDSHHCLNAVRREKEMAPTMERVLKAARDRGVVIIHAPSSCMDAYKDHPARKHATETPRSKALPKEIASWCYKIPSEEKGVYPIDQTDGGEDDDPLEHKKWAEELTAMGRNPRAPWKSQIDVLTIADKDYISDNGEEIWSILEARGVKNVALMGVHLNMCVLGRPFGLRQMAKNGKNVVLMRDLTDTMYNPQRSPHVSHFAGTDLMVEHVEKYVAPTITSDQVLGGQPFRYKDDPRPRVAFVIGEDEYKTEATLPAFATAHLLKDYRVDYVLDQEGARDNLAGINLLEGADLAVISARRRVLPKEQVDALRKFVASGKPIVGIRTASHAFAPKANAKVPSGRDAWLGFDADVLGGHYTNHHGAGPSVVVAQAPGASHPILEGVDPTALLGHGSLYKVSPLANTATPLLIGSIPGQNPEPVAWVNAPATANRVFYTSLGQLEDFHEPAFNRLLKNAVDWAIAKNH
jgi:nicotinamidase-related amidase/type 1 glutamine amidotransferase